LALFRKRFDEEGGQSKVCRRSTIGGGKENSAGGGNHGVTAKAGAIKKMKKALSCYSQIGFENVGKVVRRKKSHFFEKKDLEQSFYTFGTNEDPPTYQKGKTSPPHILWSANGR